MSKRVSPPIVAGTQEAGEASSPGLIGRAARADGAGAHGETAGADTGFAEHDCIGGFSTMRCIEHEQICDCGWTEAGGAEAGCSTGDEFSAIHGGPPGERETWEIGQHNWSEHGPGWKRFYAEAELLTTEGKGTKADARRTRPPGIIDCYCR